jgi:hypothetical protein
MKTVTMFIAALILLVLISPAHASDIPVPTLPIDSSCEIDLNADKRPDIAFVAETSKGFELIVLLRKVRGFSTFLVFDSKQRLTLSCRKGKTIKLSEGKKHKTNGTYLLLEKRGNPFVAYYWRGRTIKEVWAAD